ncbi:restriction endonuclease subunit S [Herbaspirillum sp. RV1423]|uniref:restriction endonuclease subunit S n=1 Tax=Herbaspirillum sp. RV1423 TaxID=1443993 RepID=UPI00068560BC|nr:restriction endonuclease subunit S [Herbaspirillum sp. RV1423]
MMLPKGWTRAPLGECARFLSGNTPSKEDTDYWGGEFPWITAKDMKRLCLNQSGLGLTANGKSVSTIAPAGSILVLTRGMTLLKDLPVGIAMREMAFNQDIKALVANEEINPWFLAYQLISNKSEILNLVDTAGHGTGRLDTDLLKQYEIDLPPKKEQQAISEAIQVWDRSIGLYEAQVAKLRVERRDLMRNLLTGKRRISLSETDEDTSA